MNNTQEKALLTVNEVARELSVVPPTVYRLIWRGELIGVKIGRTVRVRADDLTSFINARRITERPATVKEVA
jgi:excisionase family DNA binding protein